MNDEDQIENDINSLPEQVENEQERRASDDRRSSHSAVSFPYKTKEGLVILKDRRKTPDRRVNNISVEDTEIDEEEFIKNYQKFI